MGTQVTAGAGWPEVGERDPNPRAHGRKIQSEINAVLERARAATGKGRSTAIPRAKIVPLLESVLDYIGKGPAEAQGGMHPQATTKDDLDAFAAKILAAVSVQPQVSPTASWARRSYSDALSSGTPQSIPQSALSRMTSTSAAPISSRQAREVRVKTNFSNQQRTRPGHSRTSKEVVNMANAGIDRAGLYQGQPGIYAIEMATVQPSGDYLLLAKDAATAERLIKNGPKWVTSLGGNAEVITPTYGVIAMNIPASTFNPQDQQQMKQMLVGSNPQLLKGHEINHMDWHKKPKPGSDTGSIVISFLTKEGANAAIAAKVIAWEYNEKRTFKYSRACKTLQCFKCYEYGHTTRSCSNTEKCGHCAEEHLTKDCPAPAGTKICALCKGPHKAWDRSCKYGKKEMERVAMEIEKVRQQPYYPEDPAISPGPSERGSERGSVVSFASQEREEVMGDAPTPAEAAAMTSNASQIASSMASQSSRERNPALTSILKNGRTPQRARAKAGKTQLAGISPNYNVGRRYEVMAELLRRQETVHMDIIAIQEPWINPHNGNTHNPAKNLFHTVLPDTEERPRVCLYVNRALNIQKLKAHSYESRDIISITIDADVPIVIHNIYNPITDGSPPNPRYQGIPGNSVIPTLDQALHTYREYEQITMGDFNLQHPDWTGQTERASPNNYTASLRNIFSRTGSVQCLPAGTITRPPDRLGQVGTTIDLVWATERARHAIQKCEVQPDMDCDSDHLPIETTLDLRPPQRAHEMRRNYKAMNLQKLRDKVCKNLQQSHPLRTQAQIDTQTEHIATTITEAIDEATPQVRVHITYTRKEYSLEASAAIKECRRARRRWQRQMDQHSKKELNAARRKKATEISRSNRHEHRERVAQVDSPEALWKLARWVRNKDNTKPVFTPNLRYQGRTIQDWRQKAGAFAETFFPPPPEADMSDTIGYEYPQPAPCPDITEEEVLETIRQTAGNKAPGPDQIPNKVLKVVGDIIAEPLQNLFNACMALQHCPQHFKHSTTVVIPKPGKPSHKETKAYRPIALMNTIGKVLDSVLAKRLQYYAEQYHLLPRNHTGGRNTKGENVGALQDIHKKAEDWARRTGSVFAPQKYEMIHFANGRKDQEDEAPLVLPTATVRPRKTAKLLGVILDKKLTGLPHAEHLREKAKVSIRGIQAIAGSTWGITLQQGVQLYKATILPKLAYASSTGMEVYRTLGARGRNKHTPNRPVPTTEERKRPP
ncbi:hypothetical protein KCU64_g14772, partial [Aureobasidium melanogenum]